MTTQTKQVVRRPDEGTLLGVAGHRYRIVTNGAETGGRYTLVQGTVPPGDGPPPHEHDREDESFYVVDGSLTFLIDGRETTVGPGAFVLVPRGCVHTFRNPGPGDARVLILADPAGIETFFQEVGVPISDPADDPPPATVEHLEKIVSAAPRYGITMHLPGPS